MKGGIYSSQKCPLCGATFRDNRKDGLVCPKHPEQKATRFRVYFMGAYRRCNSYKEAEGILTGWRYKHYDENTFDVRDYRKTQPLGFENLARQFLNKKKFRSNNHFLNTRADLNRAIMTWGNKNIKEISFGDIEDLLDEQPLSDKSKYNLRSSLHQFFAWVQKREGVSAPDLPTVDFRLKRRATISKHDQDRILEEIKELTWHISPKIWFGILLLTTYIVLRPGDLYRIRERDIDREKGYLYIREPKNKNPIEIPLLEEDLAFFRAEPEGFPDMPYFRWGRQSGVRPGKAFGRRLFYLWWKRACQRLGIEDVDLYGGTRHSSAQFMRKEGLTPEEIKRATIHRTNKAFERYLEIEGEELREIYGRTRKKETASIGKIVPLRKDE